MSHMQYIDELIREYLLFRGFNNTLKSFDAELKLDKDKGFRVDRIVDQLLQYVSFLDLNGLRELWNHLDQKMFSKLDSDYSLAVKKLEHSLLKLYLVNAVVNGKSDKVTEFFNKMTTELQSQPEWKDWFMLPYIKNPEENPMYAVYFTKQWLDTLVISLHNFLSIIFQAMPQPVLSSYEEDAKTLWRLQEENETLKHKLATLSQCSNSMPDAVPPIDIMDDFYIIAQESGANPESQSKGLKSLIRTIGGLPSSPVMGRKPPSQEEVAAKHPSKRGPQVVLRHSQSSEGVPKRSLSLDSRTRRSSGRDPSSDPPERRGHPSKKDNFLLLSQEKFNEHKATISQCRFNGMGSLVASCDLDGCLKLWSPSPTPMVEWSLNCDSALTSLCWVGKNERYFLSGSKDGILRLHDGKECKTVWEVGSEDGSPLKDTKMLSVSCSSTESTVACTVLSLTQGQGRLLLFDIKSRKLEHSFKLDSGCAGVVASCCEFNHNGTLLMAGCSDGIVRTMDLRYGEWLDSWEAHDGPVAAMAITHDHNLCYTMGAGHKLCRHNLALPEENPWSAMLPKCHSTHGTQGFALHPSGKHVLTACGHAGGSIYQVSSSGIQLMLSLSGHKSPLVTCDWSTANQCSTCLTASRDGKVRISTILTP